MNNTKAAKIFGWLGSALAGLSSGGALGKFSSLGGALGAILMGLGVHQASNTDGSK